jgi:hypothetical protein
MDVRTWLAKVEELRLRTLVLAVREGLELQRLEDLLLLERAAARAAREAMLARRAEKVAANEPKAKARAEGRAAAELRQSCGRAAAELQALADAKKAARKAARKAEAAALCAEYPVGVTLLRPAFFKA